ncbi:hypothetical protein ACFXD5_07965 [Streptomyces sp. NPDC059385]|uniref:hypothetical protein n=1 Tax=Streptomyces sp. NPDC059385 TaxID=3346817 RepID=UPI0036ABDCD1
MGSSRPTSIKASEATRDRLRVLAQERGTTITELLEELAHSLPTRAEQEQEQRALQAAAELGLEYTGQVQEAGHSAWERVRAHRDGAE